MENQHSNGPTKAQDNFSDALSERKRRLQEKVSEFWQSARGEERWPSLRDFQGPEIAGFRPYSFLLDVRDRENPTFLYVGEAYSRRSGGRPSKGSALTELPIESFLFRVARLFRAAMNAKSSFAFEGEAEEASSARVLYRGILCPLSENRTDVQFIYGVVNWKVEKTGSEDAPVAPANSALEETLAGCRHRAANLGRVSGRSREKLYTVLADCMRFYVAATSNPEGYKEILRAAELKAQKRAPFTPVLKLILGKGYDKTRITEYAAALSYAMKHDITPDGLAGFLADVPGGIKGCVKAERRAKKSRTRTRDPLNHSEAMALLDKQSAAEAPLPMEHDYDLVLARKGADGRAEIISVPGVSRSTVKAAMLRAAKRLKK